VEAFSLGAVVVPASDGTLHGLGHDVRALGERALGFVVESRSKKAFVQFPELGVALWLDTAELADVYERAKKGSQEFQSILPKMEAYEVHRNFSWLVCKLVKHFDAKFILGFEQSGRLQDLWSDPHQKIEDFFQGSLRQPARYLGLGLPELTLSKWHEMEKFLNKSLLFARFLPSGMHKLELALYLSRM